MKPVTSHAAVLALALATIPAAGRSASRPPQPSRRRDARLPGALDVGHRAARVRSSPRPRSSRASLITTINDRRFPPALEARLTPASKAAYLKFKDMATRGSWTRSRPRRTTTALPRSPWPARP